MADNPKEMFGKSKPRLSLIPPALEIYAAQVFALGAAKYGPFNWRENPVKHSDYLEAAMRHLKCALDGEKVDPESGRPHEAHVIACMGIILDCMAMGTLIDDLPKPGPAADLIRAMTNQGTPWLK